ncbi:MULTISPECIES: type VII secretion protein EccE [Mycolicibacter]|uniref:Type VII secretion protein EccE n=2 Tax=Mycolicibacter TaxID=1073531 RepID=A0ABU5XL76_9MYCO|nr:MULTISPECIES: type VII secretion protein EccE [unclassified Mycolicibacter]MEB3022954.1 type VII secretion protein EccE [Mycolicibacter sp. MYC098]MEB3033464.1 type VII secretion protein EccE [Mycolicibacter sp. MYC340]
MIRDRRWGIQFRTANVWFLANVVLIAVMIAALMRLDDLQVLEVGAATAGVAVVLGVITYRSRTLLGWLGRRLSYRRATHAPISVYSTSNVGHTWDGRQASVYIALRPQPYEVTVIGSDEESTIRSIPIDAIREELTQFDIACDHVSVLTFAYKYVEGSQAATISHTAVGPIGAMLYGSTVLEVSVALNGSLDSVYARQSTDGVAVGLSRTVTVAADRIRRRLQKLGWNATLLTLGELEEFQEKVGAELVDKLDSEHWASCGASAMQASLFTPAASAWTAGNYSEWLKLNTHRHLEMLRLTRKRDGSDHAELYLGYLNNDPNALKTVRATGLRPEFSQQAAILTAAIPALLTEPTSAVQGKDLARSEAFPVPMQAGGVGTFVGLTKTRAQVFVNFSVGSEPFYLIAPAALCQQLLLRLSTSGLSIDIDIPGDEWKQFARNIGASYQKRPTADVVLSNQEGLTRQARPTQVRLVWMTSEPRRIDFGIVAGPDECVLTTPAGQTRYRWLVSNAEEAMFTVRPRAATKGRHSAPARELTNAKPAASGPARRTSPPAR